MKYLCRVGWAGFLLILVNVSGCAHQRVKVDIAPRAPTHFELKKTQYGEVLDKFGPPYRIQSLEHGFRFEYRSHRSDEWNITLQRNGLKGSYSFGGIWRDNWLFEFDDDGVLLSQNERSAYLSLGWGGIIGHSLIDEPFFGVRIYPTPRRREEDWGFDSLRQDIIADPYLRRLDIQEYEDNGTTLRQRNSRKKTAKKAKDKRKKR